MSPAYERRAHVREHRYLRQRAQYCPTCDLGCCAGNPEATIDVTATTCTGALVWPGKQWSGPSDAGNEPGAPFPPGDYVVRATFDADKPIDTLVELPIQVK